MRRGLPDLACAVVLVLLSPELARAESSVPCIQGKLVEVFAGTADCPRAHYAVFEVSGDVYSGGYFAAIFELDHCAAVVQTFSSPPASGLASMSSGTRLLVARSEAESLFGLPADVPANGYLPSPSGRISYGCPSASELIYGSKYAGSVAPPLESGKALKWDGSSWVLGDPSPVNAQGQTGTAGACPDDAGVPGSGGVAGAAGSGGFSPCGGTGGGSSGGSGASSGTGGTSAGAGGSAPKDASADGPDAASGGASINDAGEASPSEPAESSCACGMRGQDRSAAWLLAFGLLALALRRRSSR